MIQFKDAQGDIVTPKSGDYVMASDMKTEEKHNAVREELSKYFGDKGYGKYGGEEDDVFNVIMVGGGFGVEWANETNHLCKRRLIPIYQAQTLFEAAKDAPDGTRFKLGSETLVKTLGTMKFEDDGCIAGLHVLARTDFEIIPSGPVKADKILQNLVADYNKAQKLISNLLKWPGAQIGKPGWVIGVEGRNCRVDWCTPLEVSFHEKEQCEAAWKHECPELFK